MKKIRVLIADDHTVLRAGLTRLLNAESDIEVIGQASNCDEAVVETVKLVPDVLLLDISMPGVGGIDVIRQIKVKMVPVAILVLTMHENEGYLREALKAGALGYIPKKAAEAELISAIRAVHQGEIFIYPSLVKYLVSDAIYRSTPDSKIAADSFQQLSQRERDVLRLLSEGFTNQQIADQLFVSVKTVETYKARVMDKLNLHNRVELVRYALQRGLLT